MRRMVIASLVVVVVGGSGLADDAAATLEVTSSVDRSCLSDLNLKISGSLPQEHAAAWADACRNVVLDEKRCKVTSSTEDSGCLSELNLKISGNFTDENERAVVASCKQIVATCKVKKRPTEFTSSVGSNCVSERWLATSGRPSWDTALEWLDPCRPTTPSKKCIVVGGGPDLSCMGDINLKAAGKPSPAQAATLATKCRRIEMRCPE